MTGIISRRDLLAAGMILPIGWSDAGWAAKSRVNPTDAAFLFGFPAFEMARLAAAAKTNQFTHRKTLADHLSRGVTMPNNDTLYSQCRFDLSAGVIDLELPQSGGRYLSVALMDAFTNNVAVLGHETARRFRIVGPAWRGPQTADRKLVRMPTSDGWLLVRTFVEGAGDLANARSAQDGIGFQFVGESVGKGARVTPISAFDPANFIAVVNEVLARTDPRGVIRRQAAKFAECGFGPGEISAASGLPEAMRLQWQQTMERMRGLGFGDFGRAGVIVNGWSWPDRRIGTSAASDALRAGVALSGIGALPSEEALYLTAVSDNNGEAIKPGHQYSLTLPIDDIANAFWSLSAYQGEADGRFFFADNPIHRYAINSATSGLAKNANGQTTIAICTAQPDSGATNWLPLPRSNPRLVFRIYRPKPRLKRILPPIIDANGR